MCNYSSVVLSSHFTLAHTPVLLLQFEHHFRDKHTEFFALDNQSQVCVASHLKLRFLFLQTEYFPLAPPCTLLLPWAARRPTRYINREVIEGRYLQGIKSSTGNAGYFC